MAATAKNWTIDKAPKRLQLFGDQTKKIESAQHIIEFPGGAVEIARCDDGSYWAHIIVNRGFSDGDCEGMSSARGEIVGGRIDCAAGVIDIPGADSLTQIAVRIMPR